MQKQTIILADEQYLIRLALRQLLEDNAQYEVVDEVVDEEDLLRSVIQHKPRLVVMDYTQENSFHLETIEKVKRLSPSTDLLIISSDADKKRIAKVLEMGIKSYLTKSCDEEEIIDAVNATVRGEKFYCTRIIDFLLEKSFTNEPKEAAASNPLSQREIEIVQLIASGMIAKEIAHELNLSTHTIYTHRKNIMKKLRLNSSSELVVYAMKNGLLPN